MYTHVSGDSLNIGISLLTPSVTSYILYIEDL